jgi:tetratricopeptide (TPR) repeat protein
MSKMTNEQIQQVSGMQEERADRIARAMPRDGKVEPQPGLFFHRVSSAAQAVHGVLEPSFCVIAQGSKEVLLLRWADRDLAVAAQCRPATADADRKSIAPYAAIDPPGFGPAELPAQLDDLVKMAAGKQPFDALVRQATRIVKGEWNSRKVEADEYRDRKRQLVAATLANPQNAQPLVDLASFLYEQSCYIHGEAREGVGVVSFRLGKLDAERREAIASAQAALKIDPGNARAMACIAGSLVALGDEDNARPIIDQALAVNPNEPELLRMFSQVATHAASKDIDVWGQYATPSVWEDDQYTWQSHRSPWTSTAI